MAMRVLHGKREVMAAKFCGQEVECSGCGALLEIEHVDDIISVEVAFLDVLRAMVTCPECGETMWVEQRKYWRDRLREEEHDDA